MNTKENKVKNGQVKKGSPQVETKKLRTLGEVMESAEQKGMRLVSGHTYEFKEAGTLVGGEKFKCALCGGIGKNYIELMDENGNAIRVGKTCLARPALKVVNVPTEATSVGRPKKSVPSVKKPKEAPKEAKVAGSGKEPVKRDRGKEVLAAAVVRKTGIISKKVNVVKEDDKKARDKKLEELLNEL